MPDKSELLKSFAMYGQHKVLFVTIDGGGNIPPVLGLARRLSEKGLEIFVLSEPCMEELVRSAGFTFIPFRNYFTRTDRKEDLLRDANTSAMNSPVVDKIVFGPAKVIVDETFAAIQSNGIDLLVVDCLLLPALIAAEAAGIPGVIAFHFPEYMPGPNRPPGMMGLLPGRNLFGKMRDKLLGAVFTKIFNKHLDSVNSIRSFYSLAPLRNLTDLVHRADLRLIQTLRSFDFPIEPPPANVRYTGPVLDDPDWTEPWSNPWPADDTRPLIVVSLSSTFQDQARTIQSVIDSLALLPVRGLVTLGLAMQDQSFHLPENVLVVKSAPHSSVFPHASLVITHAGHGTIMRALSFGLPLLCLPMGRDQNDNAAKVAFHECGLRLSSRSGPEEIKRAVLKILSDRTYKQQAEIFRKNIVNESERNSDIEEICSLFKNEKV